MNIPSVFISEVSICTASTILKEASFAYNKVKGLVGRALKRTPFFYLFRSIVAYNENVERFLYALGDLHC